MKIYQTNALLKTEDYNGVICAYPKHIIGYIRESESFQFRNLMNDSNFFTDEASNIQNEAGANFADGDALQTDLDSYLGV